MVDKKAVLLEHFEIVKSYIDNKDAKNIKSAEFVDDVLKFYASEDKSGEALAEITLPEEMFLDGSKTELVNDFSWSITKYPKSTDPDLDGKAVLILAVKSKKTVRYSFVSLDTVITRLAGGETESANFSIADDVITLDVKVSELSDNRLVLKDDGLYVGTVDNTTDLVISTDEEVGELFSVSGAPIISANSLGARNVGDIVKINENGVPKDFIIVHKGNPDPEIYDDSCDGVWLLREKMHNYSVSWNAAQNNDYEHSSQYSFLQNKYPLYLDLNVQEIIKTVKIPFVKGVTSAGLGVQKGESGLICKIFSLSACEIGGTSEDFSFNPYSNESLSFHLDEGAILQYFDVETLAEKKLLRQCEKTGNNNNTRYLLRSPLIRNDGRDISAGHVVCSTGVITSANLVTNQGTRPAFILPYNTLVNSDGLITG